MFRVVVSHNPSSHDDCVALRLCLVIVSRVIGRVGSGGRLYNTVWVWWYGGVRIGGGYFGDASVM